MRRFLIDTDTASDDAVALVMALKHPDIQVEAITLVAGNVPLDQGLQNALYTVELCESQVPVYAGCAKPLMRRLHTAQDTHGTDGMGDIGLPLWGRTPAQGHAVDVILDTVNRFPGEITLVTLGPLTNIAVALLKDPTLAAKIPRCVVMGGVSDYYGNVTPVAEYNLWTDPDAAKVVLESGLPLTLVGWDISRKYATFTSDTAQDIRDIGTSLAEFCMDIQSAVTVFNAGVTQLPGFDLPDPIAMAIAIEPEIATESTNVYVTIETQSDLCRGQIILDPLSLYQQPPNARVVMVANQARFVAVLRELLSS